MTPYLLIGGGLLSTLALVLLNEARLRPTGSNGWGCSGLVAGVLGFWCLVAGLIVWAVTGR